MKRKKKIAPQKIEPKNISHEERMQEPKQTPPSIKPLNVQKAFKCENVKHQLKQNTLAQKPINFSYTSRTFRKA